MGSENVPYGYISLFSLNLEKWKIIFVSIGLTDIINTKKREIHYFAAFSSRLLMKLISTPNQIGEAVVSYGGISFIDKELFSFSPFTNHHISTLP